MEHAQKSAAPKTKITNIRSCFMTRVTCHVDITCDMPRNIIQHVSHEVYNLAYTHTHTHTHAQIKYTRTYTNTATSMCACLCMCSHFFVRARLYLCEWISGCLSVHLAVCIYINHICISLISINQSLSTREPGRRLKLKKPTRTHKPILNANISRTGQLQ